MSTQREITYTGTVRCTCGKLPKAYVTDGRLYHVECYPCQHISLRLSSLHAASVEFGRMMAVKRADEYAFQQNTQTALDRRVVLNFNRGSRT